MRKYKCLLCEYIYDPPSVTRKMMSPPAPLLRICRKTGSVPIAVPTKTSLFLLSKLGISLSFWEGLYMQDIKPSVVGPEIICADIPAGPAAVIVFGASGDLARRKLFISLFELYKKALVGENFYLLGCARTNLTDAQFRSDAENIIRQLSPAALQQTIAAFVEKLYYLSGDYADSSFYQSIKNKLAELDKKHNVEATHVFYLAVPPVLYETIIEHLGAAALSCAQDQQFRQGVRLVVEKPFGSDLATAAETE